MPKGKILFVTQEDGMPSSKMIKSQRNKNFYRRVKAGFLDGVLWMYNKPCIYTEKNKFSNIMIIVIDWLSFSTDFPKRSINLFLYRIKKLHPDIPIVEVGSIGIK